MPDEAILIRDQYYIRAGSSRLDDRTRVLKHGDSFAVFDRFGDIDPLGSGELGLYHADTRFLSRLALRLEGKRPLLLESMVKQDNTLFRVDLMNADTRRDGGQAIARGALHLFRSKVLLDDACHERLRLHNYSLATIEFDFTVQFDADFADLFEVRGMPRAQRGRLLEPRTQARELTLGYEGRDGRTRRTHVVLDAAPDWNGTLATFHLRLGAHDEANFSWAIACEIDESGAAGCRGRANGPAQRTPREGAQGKRSGPPQPGYQAAADRVAQTVMRNRERDPKIDSSNAQFNDWLDPSLADLHLLCTSTPYGPYPYAGVPWYSTVFGRDGIVTALEFLWMNPALARGVLSYLAAIQADTDDPERDAQPGKILHETRGGEMAALGEVPFGCYYGSIDATPLFVVLADAYYRRTADIDFVFTLWPHVDRALDWIDRCGDVDGDGFYEYARRSATRLRNQGWKDSHDAIFHADGSQAEGPIALCEMQAYVYAAKLAGARLSRLLGGHERAQSLERAAAQLRDRFAQTFWCEGLGTYAMALDGDKRPCRVVSSNAGQCLFTGIALREHAERIARTLTADESFSGWGIRTIGSAEKGYNPMSYHNGSVWPHDNALVAAGFALYGLKDAALRVLEGLFAAAQFVEMHRLPELFCGFRRRPGEAPTLYPVACSPQAWAAGAVFLCLQACLGLEVRGPTATVKFSDPVLPAFMRHMHIRNLRIGDASVDLLLARRGGDVGISVPRRSGPVSVVTVK